MEKAKKKGNDFSLNHNMWNLETYPQQHLFQVKNVSKWMKMDKNTLKMENLDQKKN